VFDYLAAYLTYTSHHSHTKISKCPTTLKEHPSLKEHPPQNPKMKSHADRLTLLRGYLNGSPRSARSPATHSSAKHPASSTLIGVALHAISRMDGASELTGLESRLVNLMSQYATTEELREFG
jgi:hypothetical protein